MCDPASITAAAAVASTVANIYTQQQQTEYQAGVDRYNARVAENEAKATRAAGIEQEQAQRRQTAELISRQRAQLGAANVDIGSGSALQLQEDALIQGEADALRIRSNFERQAESLGTQASLLESRAEAAEGALPLQQVGTLLGGIGAVTDSGVADKWFTPESAAHHAVPTSLAIN